MIIRTLEDLAIAVVSDIHYIQRNCRCRKCHKESLQCMDCPECRKKIEEKVLNLMRKSNAP